MLSAAEDRDPAPAPAGGDQGPLRRLGRSVNVLIVEDEPLTALDFSLMIEEAGGRAAGTAASAEVAEALVKSLSPDVILMDVRLAGGTDGINAARAIRAFSDVPIVFVTGNADRLTVERIRAFNGSAPVPKPVIQEALVNAVVKALSGSAPFDG